jgi:hypothetical protein
MMFEDEGFVKIYGSILQSSLLLLPVHVRWCFVAMLAAAKPDGTVRTPSVRTLAHLVNLTPEETESALAILEAPDPDSTTPDEEGRRVIREQGYWRIVNHKRYREHQTKKQVADAARARASRGRKRDASHLSHAVALNTDLKLNPPDQNLAVVAPPHTAPRGSDLGNSSLPLSSDPGADPQLDLPCARANGPGDQAPHPADTGEVPPASSASGARRPAPVSPATLVARSVWEAYAAAYHARYGDWPVRNARVNGQLAQFVRRVPAAEAALIAEHFLRSSNARYIHSGHSIGSLLADAEKLRTEWATGKRITAHSAREQDKQAGRFDAYQEVLAQAREIDRAAGRISK